MKKYLSNYPDLIKELHPTKNGDFIKTIELSKEYC